MSLGGQMWLLARLRRRSAMVALRTEDRIAARTDVGIGIGTQKL